MDYKVLGLIFIHRVATRWVVRDVNRLVVVIAESLVQRPPVRPSGIKGDDGVEVSS